VPASSSSGRAVGHAAARRPRCGCDQDRGPGLAWRRRPLRAALSPRARTRSSSRPSNRNKRSVSLDLRHPEAHGVFEDLVRGSDVVYSNAARRPAGEAGLTYDDLEGRQSSDRLLLAVGFGMSGPSGRPGRLRLHDAGPRRVDEPDGRSRRPADEEAASRSSISPAATRRRSPCWPGCWRAAATASAATATSRCSTRRCTS
jgi:hypothetical protein